VAATDHRVGQEHWIARPKAGEVAEAAPPGRPC
jgi:hypothetical protein